MGNTGRRIYPFLRQVDTATGLPTGIKKANVPEDPDYVPPQIDYVACPVQAWAPIDPFCITQKSCPSGWTLNEEGTACVQVQNTAATFPQTVGQIPSLVQKVNDIQWNNGGARLYDAGYPLDGNGTVLDSFTIPHLWVNGDALWSPTRNLVDSRMNAAAVWSQNFTPNGEYIGFSKKIDLSAAKTYYLGISADNGFRVILNGVTILDVTNIDGGPNFNYWNIYPISFPKGQNFLEVLGVNGGGVAGLGAELYDMTRAQLQAVTDANQFNIAFSTADYVGQFLHIGTTQGYSCPQGWSLDVTGMGAPVCRRTLSQAPAQVNSGMKGFANRARISNGIPDGFTEPNEENAGLGPYFPPVLDLINCPI